MKEKFPKDKKKGEILWKNLEVQIDEEGGILLFDKILEKDKRKSENKEWHIFISLNEMELMRKIKYELYNTKGKSEKEGNKNKKKVHENKK